MVASPQIRDMQIKEAFNVTEDKLENGSKIDSMFSGTTTVVVWIWNNTVVCANAGDSRAIISSKNSAGIWSC
jgi:serine/threonine protein phosphatase PrpC